MTDSRIFGFTSKLIENALDVSARRHTLIAGNIANMDTIGHKPKDLCDQDFKREPKTGFSNTPVLTQDASMHFDFLKKIKEL